MHPTKVFVGGLPSGSKPHDLRRLFTSFGVVTECDIMNRCGFVHMETPQMAAKAIQALHNTQFNGATLSVEPGRDKKRISGGNSASREGSGGGPMRHERNMRGSGRKNEPYSRESSSMDSYQERFGSDGARSRNLDTRSRSNYSSSSAASSNLVYGDRYGDSSSTGMGSQDKRGFALPDRSFNDRRGRGMDQTLTVSDSNRNYLGGSSIPFHPSPYSKSVDPYREEYPSFDYRSEKSFYRGESRSARGDSGGGYLHDNYREAFPPLGLGRGGTDFRREDFNGRSRDRSRDGFGSDFAGSYGSRR